MESWATSSVLLCPLIGVDLSGILIGRMASAEGGSVPSGVEYGDRKLILAYLEGHRTLLFVPI